MPRIPRTAVAALVLLAASVTPGVSLAQSGGDSLVTSGSPPAPFSANKQNEPAVAVDPRPGHTSFLAAGANDNIDMEACNAGPDNDCPFTEGVGVSGVSFSDSAGDAWTQPTYTGMSARECTGVVGDDDPECEPDPDGFIGTLPWYTESGLVADGDPALAFGPAYIDGEFTWDRARLYYANLTSKLPGSTAFKGAEAIAVSRTDDAVAAMVGVKSAWMRPVIASKQSGGTFSDKEQIWADNAESSPHFGNVYICIASFRGNGNGFTNQPLVVTRSQDGGDTWSSQQLTPAANNVSSRQGFGRSGCTVRTDSKGNVYVFVFQFGFSATEAAPGEIQMFTSTDGGRRWSKPQTLFTAFDTCDYFEPSIGRCVTDGVAGARSDLSPAPSVDIANGAPTGADATDRIVITWVDGEELGEERVMFATAPNPAGPWTTPVDVRLPGDRGLFSAPAISPNGTDVWLVYNAFTTPFRFDTRGAGNDRQLVGVVRHADVTGGGVVWTPGEVHRGESGDARGSSQNNLAAEFLGDYVYAAATRTYGAAVWNDVRDTVNCDAIDEYRWELHEEAVATGSQTAEAEEPRGEEERHPGNNKQEEEEEPEAPDVQQECPETFGNSDIFGGGYADPTP